MLNTVKRPFIFLLAVALVLGTSLQLTPQTIASAMPHDSAMSGHVGSHGSDAGAPCKGMSPACMDQLCCAIVLALPTASAAAPHPVEWTTVLSPVLVSALRGHAIEPELFPPIVLA